MKVKKDTKKKNLKEKQEAKSIGISVLYGVIFIVYYIRV